MDKAQYCTGIYFNNYCIQNDINEGDNTFDLPALSDADLIIVHDSDQALPATDQKQMEELPALSDADLIVVHDSDEGIRHIQFLRAYEAVYTSVYIAGYKH